MNQRGYTATAADRAAAEMKIRIYLPLGSHEKGSLPCVLVPPAGTTLLTGSEMDKDPANPEHLPYVRAGFCVVTFSLDGVPMPWNDGQPVPLGLTRFAYMDFARSYAGLINFKTAWGVAQHIAAVDRNQIYVAGHSSAGTLALLFSTHVNQIKHSPKLAGCIAYAPECDVEAALSEYVNSVAPQWLPGGKQFIVRSSPKTHAAGIECPVFLFHSGGDQVTPFSRTQAFHDQLETLGKDVTLVRSNGSDHYQTMIDEGIPAALKWLAVQRTKVRKTETTSKSDGTDVAASSSTAAGWRDDVKSDNPVGIRPVRPQDHLKAGTNVFARATVTSGYSE